MQLDIIDTIKIKYIFILKIFLKMVIKAAIKSNLSIDISHINADKQEIVDHIIHELGIFTISSF